MDVNEEDVRWERKLVPKAEGKRRGVQPRAQETFQDVERSIGMHAKAW